MVRKKNTNALSDCFHKGIQKIIKILQYCVDSDSAVMDEFSFSIRRQIQIIYDEKYSKKKKKKRRVLCRSEAPWGVE